MNSGFIYERETYDLRGLRFLHVDISVRCCIPQHVEIVHNVNQACVFL
jgi:NADH:ubiquinone oxidoreductase subunit C